MEPSCWPSAPHPTPWGPSTTSPGRSPWLTRPRRWRSWTPSTSRRTTSSTSRRGAATSWSARPTSFRLFGPPPGAPRTPTISLVVAKIPATEVAIRLARRGIFASHGNFYAQTVAERLGQARDGLLRLGCACYTTENEVDRVVESLRAIAQGHD